MEESEAAEGLHRSEFFREMFVKELTTKDEEIRHITKVLSENNLFPNDLTDELNVSLKSPKYANNFPSVTSLPSYPEDKGEWLSPNIFRDILDKKENGWEQAEEKEQQSRPSVIVREKDIPNNYPKSLDKDNMESNLIRLQTENIMLKQELVMMKQSHDPGISGQDSEDKYEKLMKEVSKLKSVVDKMENSKTMYEASTVQLATFLDRLSTQLADEGSHGRLYKQQSGSFDSLLSSLHSEGQDSGSYWKPGGDNSIGSYNIGRQGSTQKTLPGNNIPAYSGSYNRLLDIGSRETLYIGSRIQSPIQSEPSIGMPEVPREHECIAGSLDCIVDSGRASALRRQSMGVGTGWAGRSKIRMGSNTIRKDLSQANTRLTNSSVNLAGEKNIIYDKAEKDDFVKKYEIGDSRKLLKGRSKSFASVVSNKVMLEEKTLKLNEKPKTKVQRFFLQLRNLVKEKPKIDPKAKWEKLTGKNLDDELDACKDGQSDKQTTNKVRNSVIRSKSQKQYSTQSPNKELRPSHQSTPRLLLK